MHTDDINNFFGDMDLYLMDLILKGVIPEGGRVLDIGCGEGRNAVYFLKNNYQYEGIDADSSKIRLLAYMSQSLSSSFKFYSQPFEQAKLSSLYDVIVCSRVLHFMPDADHLLAFWKKIRSLAAPGAIIYACMDSTVASTAHTPLDNGLTQYPDGAVRLALTSRLYDTLCVGFEEVHPLITVTHRHQRTQSFMALKMPS